MHLVSEREAQDEGLNSVAELFVSPHSSNLRFVLYLDRVCPRLRVLTLFAGCDGGREAD